MDFFRAFEDIDRDYSGEITREELTEYVKRNNFQAGFVERWLDLFDIDHSGTITIKEFCDVLGLRPPQYYLDKVNEAARLREVAEVDDETVEYSTSRKLLSGKSRDSSKAKEKPQVEQFHREKADVPQILSIDPYMHYSLRQTIIHFADIAIGYVNKRSRKHDSENNHRAISICRMLKQNLENFEGNHWNVIVSEHQFSSCVSHEPGCFIQFLLNGLAFLVWKVDELSEDDEDFFM